MDLADDIDGGLDRLFRSMAVTPMMVDELGPIFHQEWNFMDNAILFGCNGVIRRRQHRLPRPQVRLFRGIAGARV